jgi:hypothetical protein
VTAKRRDTELLAVPILLIDLHADGEQHCNEATFFEVAAIEQA